ncbi:hypothetical protein [Pseudoalteromonas xiamenensis]|uniref:Transposase n=1 Tax=Pseudoalteromonas xiamenensis TaxID=882626 RepID=A0A975HMA6_9GAMM|nr:hypothetical protein [Pseudoalteromonas xiamenensis]QTH72956.1 hypothetical protein J5O05_17485 [Pseudoalteromonas xiamenensis]
MTHIKTLGIDLGKTSFHIIAWYERKHQVKKAKYSRSKLIEFIIHLPPCDIAMEGCADLPENTKNMTITLN